MSTPLIMSCESVLDRFEIVLMEDESHYWISCREPGTGAGGFWSRARDQSGCTPEQAIAAVRQRLTDLIPRHGVFRVFQFWPDGWDFWGAGTPAPIFDFINSQEFQSKIAAWRAGRT